MVSLTANQQSFLTLMEKDSEHARRGFELLLKRTDLERFFEPLSERGFFAPNINPRPVEGEKPGSFRIPYWDAMAYLEALAKQSSEGRDLELARKIRDLVRTIGRWREPDGTVRDNYRTFQSLADILGTLPIEILALEDIDLIEPWLKSRFDRALVGRSLSMHLMPKLLDSSDLEAKEMATRVIGYCTGFRWMDEAGLSSGRRKAKTYIDDFWLGKFVETFAADIGLKLGRTGVEVFLNRVRELFGEGYRIGSWLGRPAVEAHSQNFDWNGVENNFVDGLRDSLTSWIDQAPDAAAHMVLEMIRDEVEMVRRVGIFALNAKWGALDGIYLRVLDQDLFRSGHLHEIYGLLQTRFALFTDEQKRATLSIIRDLADEPPDERAAHRERHYQRQLLSAVTGRGSAEADQLYSELDADPSLGTLSIHPDFNSYMEVWSGFGETPFSSADLLGLLPSGTLIEALNAFHPSGEWRAPTVQGLVHALEQAVCASPLEFVEQLEAFLRARRPYQYAIIQGFKRVWETPPGAGIPIDWSDVWPRLIGFFEAIVSPPEFWSEPVEVGEAGTAHRDWIAPTIADFIRSGSKDDANAFEVHLIPRAITLLEGLLQKTDGMKEMSRDDPLGEAINTAKGRVLEAFVILILRACRMADQEGEHVSIWKRVEPTFDRELASCRGSNFVFSAIVGLYIGNLDYMSHEWVEDRLEEIFPFAYPDNFRSALEGLAYSHPIKVVYWLLRDRGIVDFGLKLEKSGKFGRQKLLERMAVAYLWNDDELSSPRFSYLFENDKLDDLSQICQFFWNISNQKLEEPQSERIMAFSLQCIAWAKVDLDARGRLLADVAHLACYVRTLTDRAVEFLTDVAPYAANESSGEHFLQELLRLIEQGPARIASILDMVLQAYTPSHDFNGTLRGLLEALANSGHRLEAIRAAERLRGIREMLELYSQLTTP